MRLFAFVFLLATVAFGTLVDELATIPSETSEVTDSAIPFPPDLLESMYTLSGDATRKTLVDSSMQFKKISNLNAYSSLKEACNIETYLNMTGDGFHLFSKRLSTKAGSKNRDAMEEMKSSTSCLNQMVRNIEDYGHRMNHLIIKLPRFGLSSLYDVKDSDGIETTTLYYAALKQFIAAKKDFEKITIRTFDTNSKINEAFIYSELLQMARPKTLEVFVCILDSIHLTKFAAKSKVQHLVVLDFDATLATNIAMVMSLESIKFVNKDLKLSKRLMNALATLPKLSGISAYSKDVLALVKRSPKVVNIEVDFSIRISKYRDASIGPLMEYLLHDKRQLKSLTLSQHGSLLDEYGFIQIEDNDSDEDGEINALEPDRRTYSNFAAFQQVLDNSKPSLTHLEFLSDENSSPEMESILKSFLKNNKVIRHLTIRNYVYEGVQFSLKSLLTAPNLTHFTYIVSVISKSNLVDIFNFVSKKALLSLKLGQTNDISVQYFLRIYNDLVTSILVKKTLKHLSLTVVFLPGVDQTQLVNSFAKITSRLSEMDLMLNGIPVKKIVEDLEFSNLPGVTIPWVTSNENAHFHRIMDIHE